jgi:hypothetical protein
MNTEIVTDGRKKPRTAAQIEAREKSRGVSGRKKNDDPATVKRSRTVTINLRTELFLLEKTGLKSLSQVLEMLAEQFQK